MSTENPDYSDYMRFMSNISRIGALFAGFDFTVITLVLTRLPQPESILVQATLFAMSVLFYFLIFLVGWSGMLHVYLCRGVLPLTPRLRAFAVLAFAVHLLICVPPFLLFFLWQLFPLAWATVFCWIVFAVASVVYIWKPVTRFRATRKYFLRLP
jgi:hypothetical protein